MRKKILILYIPVLHSGYINLFKKYAAQVEALLILGEDFITEFTCRKEIRAIEPLIIAKLVSALGMFKRVEVLNRNSLKFMKGKEIITAKDEICRKFRQKYLKGQQITIDTVFLRWDEKSVFSQEAVKFDEISQNGFDRQMMELAKKEAEATSDWWRQVGAVLVKGGKVLFKAHNQALPSEHTPYIIGDPRDFIKAGEKTEIRSSLHAEPGIITQATREGVSLKDAHLYVTVFPCPACANLIAFSGISKLFFLTGHASLDGETVLKSQNIKIILVKF